MMILTCPRCATRFFVDAEKIGAAGRKVMCDACGATWTASRPSGGEEGSGSPQQTSSQANPPPLASPVATPLFVARPSERARKPAAPGRAFAVTMMALVLAVLAVFVFQRAIVRAWPASAEFYDKLGIHTEPVDLARPRG